MKKIALSLLLLFVFSNYIYCQVCNQDITLNTQTEVDNFASIYGCDTINGSLGISGNITNLNGLSGVTHIENYLYIGNTNITNLNGLNNLVKIDSSFTISNNHSLINLSGLDNLSHIGNEFRIQSNNLLSEISNSSLLYIGHNFPLGLHIAYNTSLTNIHGFNNLVFLDGTFLLLNNNSLQSVSGFNDLISINHFYCSDSPQLTSFTALSSLNELSTILLSRTPLITLPFFSKIDSLVGLTFVDVDFDTFNFFPNLVKIDALDFIDMDNLKSINLPSVDEINYLAIYNCDSLTSINGMPLLSKCRQIHFEGNEQLHSIENLYSLASIYEKLALTNNPLLENITGFHSLKYLGDIDIINCPLVNECCFIRQLQVSGRVQGIILLENNGPQCSDILDLITTYCEDPDFDFRIVDDNCNTKYNPGQTDSDEDGIGDICDNCPEVPNPDQQDTNNDGIGNACQTSTQGKIEAQNSDLYISDPKRGLIFKAENNKCYRLRVDKDGNVFSMEVACPN